MPTYQLIEPPLGIKQWTDSQVVTTTTTHQSIDHPFPIPHFYVKRIFKQKNSWNICNKTAQTPQKVDTHMKITLEDNNLTPFNTSFPTGDNRFQCVSSKICEYGMMTITEHYYHVCKLTVTWNIKRPNMPLLGWLDKILTRLLTPLKQKKICSCIAYLFNLSF